MAGSSWPALTAGRKAKASEVEAKFDWLEGSIVPMNSGTTTDLAHDLGTSTARWNNGYIDKLRCSSINPTSTAGGVAIGTTTANASTLLDISGTKAMRVPRLSTAEINALTGADGMIVFNTTTSQLQVFKGAAWGNIGGTVFSTKAKITNVGISSATVTVLNILSGGGRLMGVSALQYTTVGGGFRISIILDGNTVCSGFVTTTAHACVVRPDGQIHGYKEIGFFGNTTSALHADVDATTTAQNAGLEGPHLGWDFASTCAVYVSKQLASGGTTAAHVVYAQIV